VRTVQSSVNFKSGLIRLNLDVDLCYQGMSVSKAQNDTSREKHNQMKQRDETRSSRRQLQSKGFLLSKDTLR